MGRGFFQGRRRFIVGKWMVWVGFFFVGRWGGGGGSGYHLCAVLVCG